MGVLNVSVGPFYKPSFDYSNGANDMKLLSLLADGEFHSGDELGASLGITRAAVWKRIQRLQLDLGVDVYSVKGKGYCLSQALDLFDPRLINSELSSKA